MIIVYEITSGKVLSVTGFRPQPFYAPSQVEIDSISLLDPLPGGQAELRIYNVQTMSDVWESVDHGAQVVVNNGVIATKPIQMSLDKPQITANGTDTATITATVDDKTSTELIEFYDNTGVLIQTVACVNGQAQLPVTATVPGDIVVIAKSTTKYGQNQVLVKAV